MTIYQQGLCIQLTSMPQLAEATSVEDDWTGKRKAQEKKARESKAESSQIKSEPVVECWDIKQETMSIVPASQAKKLYNAKQPLLAYGTKQNHSNVVFPLSADHLITLLQYNALRALAVNRTFISGMLTTPLDCAGEEEVFHVIPYPTNPESLPASLLPTVLQQTVMHCDWIDMFPSPEARDCLIRAYGTFDEDDLWADCIGGLLVPAVGCLRMGNV
ncbi:hypothetical protein FBEOM_7471 [Fusarium beomiforme]|uniref:Uncharacterized protein n=1 Tax=Fusarium beomiforme TaxID=44412 RepID=A0A9P5DXQ2_9HYPO|nr:hypothetical protein FBEOM_7471 [Fusarium beomiforme]